VTQSPVCDQALGQITLGGRSISVLRSPSTKSTLPTHNPLVNNVTFASSMLNIRGGPKMAQNFYTLIILSNIKRFLIFFLTVGITRKFVVALLLKISPYHKCVATLPSEISVS